jgi:hypothetical protein
MRTILKRIINPFMKTIIKKQKILKPSGIFAILLVSSLMLLSTKQTKTTMKTYLEDLNFLKKYVEIIELTDSDSNSKVVIVPSLQGRVMTSTASGNEGFSFGWINYKLLESGKKDKHFNAFGGEDRFWLGPEGGPNSLYFAPGMNQELKNWFVPPVLDTDSFETIKKTNSSVVFRKLFKLKNYSGTEFSVMVERIVKLISKAEIKSTFGMTIPVGLKYVAYESSNLLKNNGQKSWMKDSGLLSIWMLSMFSPSPGITVFIPYKEGADSLLGPVVSDDYFGKVPPERIKIEPGIVYFKVDGKYRSKIGISPKRATPFLGSYDTIHHTLTLLWVNLPVKPAVYVNSKWGNQLDPFNGDAINSYNDGPTEDGTQLGPFYEMESSSPAAALNPGDSITHTQRIFHFEGAEEDLNRITIQLFGVSISKIKRIF